MLNVKHLSIAANSLFKNLTSGAKDYKCDMCGKEFTHKYSLSVHQKYHIGEKNFICVICNKAFIQKSHLNQHHKVHSKTEYVNIEAKNWIFKANLGSAEAV